ncbi:MAG: right-handed parallel beta-helix repeat-containing protein [Armatimonas sp.]
MDKRGGRRGLARLISVLTVLLLAVAARASIFTVTSSEDDGPGTLREALLLSNGTAGADVIRFQLPAGETTISLTSPLPDLTDSVQLLGSTQPGYAGAPLVELEGTFLASTQSDGLRIVASGCTVQGFCINRFGQSGIRVLAASATIDNCFIGLDRSGEQGLACTTGIEATNASGLQVTDSVIVGNASAIRIQGAATGLAVQRCNIGTNALGTSVVGTGEGVVLEGASGAPAVRNTLLGGCSGAALHVIDTQGALLEDNILGVSPFFEPLVNSAEGILVENAPNTVVRRNLLAFSLNTGIVLDGAATSGAQLDHNAIYSSLFGIELGQGVTGTRSTDNAIEGCLADGIRLHASAGSDNQFLREQIVGNFGNGAAALTSRQLFQECRFEDNGGDGVYIGRENPSTPYAQQVTVAASTFRANGDLSIRLVTRRDLNQGANNLQPSPVLAQAFTGGASTGAVGSLSAAPGRTYRIEFFASVNPDPSGYGEGETYLGGVTVTTSAGGNAPIIASGLAPTPEGVFLTATATDVLGNTSEFSNAVPGDRNQGPILEQISPDVVLAGSGAFTLTARGQDFTPFSKIQWDGAEQTTTFLSPTELRAEIPASLVAAPRTLAITVYTPAPGGGTSAPLTFTIANPAPILTAISPTRALVGSAELTLSVTGSNFVPGSKVRWNGAERTTTYISPTELRATILATDLATAGFVSVSVITPMPGGGESIPTTFTVANPVPAVSALSPASAFAGTTGLTVTVEGTGFVMSSVAQWNGSNRPTSYLTPTRIQITLTTEDLAVGGANNVTVTNPAPEGGVSNVARFMVAGLPQLALASASATRIGESVEVSLTLKNVGTAVLVAGSIKASALSGSGTLSALPLAFPDLAPGATSAPITLLFPGNLPAGRSVFSLTATSAGRTYSASRLVSLP